MSDTSQGPGWWIASDGKWYAAERHPNYLPPPPATAAASLPPPPTTALPAPPASLSTEPQSAVGGDTDGSVVGPFLATEPSSEVADDGATFYRKWWLWVAVTVAAVAIIVAASASSASKKTNAVTRTEASTATTAPPTTAPPTTAPPTTAPPTTAPPTTAPPTTAPPTTVGAANPSVAGSGSGHVGSTLALTDSSGDKTNVTLNQVIDPATGSDGPPTDASGNPTTSSYVATVVTITNTGSQPIQDDANSDAALIGSDGQDYTADFDDVSECTNFNDGEFSIEPGESTTGCVVFVLPAGVNPAKVQWTPDLGGNFGQWLVP